MDTRRQQFDALIRRLAPELYRYAWWLCRDSALAEDLVQVACLRAWRSVDALRDEGAAKSWLLTIIRREHARLYERKQLPVEDIAELVIEDEDSPDAHALVEVQQLRDAIARIEPKYREPLLLQVIGGYTCEEIASQLGLSAQAVMTQVFRARAKLKALLQQGGEGKVHELL